MNISNIKKKKGLVFFFFLKEKKLPTKFEVVKLCKERMLPNFGQ